MCKYVPLHRFPAPPRITTHRSLPGTIDLDEGSPIPCIVYCGVLSGYALAETLERLIANRQIPNPGIEVTPFEPRLLVAIRRKSHWLLIEVKFSEAFERLALRAC